MAVTLQIRVYSRKRLVRWPRPHGVSPVMVLKGSVTEVQPAPASLPVSERPRGSLVPLVVVTAGWMVLMVGVGFGLSLALRDAWSDAAWRVIDATLIAVAFLAPSFWVHRRDLDRWFGQVLN